MRRKAGKQGALKALDGEAVSPVPVALFTWSFEYRWKISGVAPWQLACGSSSRWLESDMALLERHDPDVLFFDGAGEGATEATLLKETSSRWYVRDNNIKEEFELTKDSLSLTSSGCGKKNCDPVGLIESTSDVDDLISANECYSEAYLAGLSRTIQNAGQRALVMPHHSPAYIRSCYAAGFETAMAMLVTNPGLFMYMCEKYRSQEQCRMNQLAGAGAEAVFIADGWASTDIISPDMIRKFAIPCQESIIKAAHNAGLKIVLWNEGDISGILPDEENLEMDAFAFEQPRKGALISVEAVRKVFGPQRCLFGNLDSEELLLTNDTDMIADGVRRQLSESGAQNPFILCTGSPIPDNAKPEAVDMIFEAARNFQWK